ncbi:MAG: homoserine kinase [Gemmatimonadetes bacterium]|nr:MAG: homoserine kinase [Gemmatimonadota bacterium]
MTARVRVPASSSNLGAGFDCIGVAVDRWLAASVTLDRAEKGGFAIRRHGKLSAVKVRPDQDLFTRGFRAACAAGGGGGVTPVGVTIDATSDIPVGCGLGSSAAAIVAGAMLADAALGLGLSRAQILEIGTTIEGHPDNIAPAIYGGAVLSVRTPAGLVSTSLSVADGLALLIVVPPFPSDTKAARAVLPRTLPHSDAVSAASRAAALVQGLSSGDGALLAAALDDVLHVPFRRARIPGYDAVVTAAQDAGAFGATLSGAGSAIVAIAPRERSAAVGTAMVAAWRAIGIEAELITCTSTVAGATVTHVSQTVQPVSTEIS